MKIFLTGGTGFIGQALVRRIRGRGWDLTVLVRDPGGAQAQWIVRHGGALATGDVTKPEGLASAMAGADALIHNAGVYEIGADSKTVRRMRAVNIDGSLNILDSAMTAGIPRTVYVSTVWALGASGRPPAPSVTRDETHQHDGRYLTPYEESKAEGHKIALGFRAKGLPISLAMPNGVVGANDHSLFGYFLRLIILGAMEPFAFGGDAVYAFVDVDALADGLCAMAERAGMGEDYLFCGDRASLREVFDLWGRETGKPTARWYLPRGFMRPQMAVMEPLLRAVGLPAFMSRDAVDASKAHLDYSSAKARRDLGWTHPSFKDMWPPIIARERALMAKRSGFLNKLRHQSVVED